MTKKSNWTAIKELQTTSDRLTKEVNTLYDVIKNLSRAIQVASNSAARMSVSIKLLQDKGLIEEEEITHAIKQAEAYVQGHRENPDRSKIQSASEAEPDGDSNRTRKS